MDNGSRSRLGPTSTAVPSDGSRTMTMANTSTRVEGGEVSTDEGERGGAIGVLRLRSKHMGNRVAWDEEVVDNEGAGKKKSKICCIYHRPRRYDESSDESSDSDSSDDEHGHAHPHSHPHPHPHAHGPSANDAHPSPVSSSSQGQPAQSEVHELELPEDDEPNAYERPAPPPRGTGKGKRKDDCALT